MKIELKNIKHAKFASQETDCFEATVYIDGVKVGIVENDGHGGSNSYHPWSLQETLNAHAATLPDIVSHDLQDQEDPTKPFTYRPHADTIIDDLFTDWLVSKDFDRIIRSRLVWTKSDGLVYQTKKLTKVEMDGFAAMSEEVLRKKLRDAVVILNRLPRDEALAIFKATA